MAGRTPYEAVRSFFAPLQLSLSCVSKTVLAVSHRGYDVSDEPHWLAPKDEELIALSGLLHLALEVMIHYRIVPASGDRGPWKVSITSYLYTLQDSDGQEIVSYHWDPRGRGRETFPHLHVGHSRGVLTRKHHLPTGRISLEEILRYAIAELGVKTRRKNWVEILDRNQQLLEDWRAWGGWRRATGE